MSESARRDEKRSMLRTSGLRATPARVAILNAMEECAGPVTHQELTIKLTDFGLDKSTIFRALQDLTQAGLMRRLELGDHVWRYELIPAETQEQLHIHPHLLCVECGSIRCLDEADVQVELSPELGKIVDVLIKGHCATCQTDQSDQ